MSAARDAGSGMSPGRAAGGRGSATAERPQLREGVRLRLDAARQGHALLYPEGAVLLNETAAAVVACMNGSRDVAGIAELLAQEYDGVSRDDVAAVVRWLAERRLLQRQPASG